MKKLISICLLASLIFISTGCMRVYGTYTMNDDGTVTVTSKEALSKEFMDEMGGNDNPNAVLETLEDGQQYYCETATETGTVDQLITSPNVTLSKDIFYYRINSNSDETVNNSQDLSNAIANSVYVKLTINLADDIVDTNANIKDETSGKTAAFDTTFIGESWYAYTAHGKELLAADSTPPVISNVENGAYYNTMPDIQFTDDTAVATATLNGKSYSIINVVSGENVIQATDLNGNTTTVTFYADVAAPVVKGIKNGKNYRGKTTFYVKDKISLSKVTIDNKPQKLTNSKLVKKGKYKNYYKFTIKKKGKHTIIATDSAGNKAKIKIRVK